MSDRHDEHDPSEHTSDAVLGDWLDAPADGDWASAAAHDVDPLRAADLALLDALLEYVHDRDVAAIDRRVDRVLAALDARPTSGRPMVDALRSPGPRGQKARGWAVAGMTIAATVVAALAGLYWSAGTASRAQAAVQRAYRDAASLKDREYAVQLQVRTMTGRIAEFDARLYVRGGERFALAHPGFLGDFWVGSNGRHFWFVPAIGGIQRSEKIQEPLDWATDHGVAMPDLQLTKLLSWLESEYELIYVGDEPGSDTAAGAVLRHVRGVQRGSATKRPRVVDLWADSTTGVAQRIVLDWQRGDDDPGVSQVTLELAAEAPLDDSWYEPESHLSKPPILRQSPLLVPQDR